MSTTETETVHGISALPSGAPVPSSAPIPAPHPAPLPNIPVAAIAAALPGQTDAFLIRLNKCLATPAGIDTVLLLTAYASRLAAVGLTSLSASALRRSAGEWLALVSSLPPRATILFAGPDAKLPVTAAAAAALVLAERLRNLAGLVSEMRTAMRLWGLLSMYLWARRLIGQHLAARKAAQTPGEKNTTTTTSASTALAWAQLLSCTAFQALENGAYLASKGVLGWDKAKQGLAARWSVRFWALFVGLEVGKLVAEGLGDSHAQKTAAEASVWRKALARNLAWAPLTVHWSLEKGFASESVVALLGLVPGVIQIRDLWRDTA